MVGTMKTNKKAKRQQISNDSKAHNKPLHVKILYSYFKRRSVALKDTERLFPTRHALRYLRGYQNP